MSASTAECASTAPAPTGNVTRIWWVQSASDSFEHAISEAAFVAGIGEGVGEYRSLCDDVLTAAALTEPPGGRCRTCVGVLRGPSPTARCSAASHHRRPRRAWGRRLGFGRGRRTKSLPSRCARRDRQDDEHLEVAGP